MAGVIEPVSERSAMEGRMETETIRRRRERSGH